MRRVIMGKTIMGKKAIILALTLLLLLVLGLSTAWAEAGEVGKGEGGSSVRLVVTIAAIWLAILAAVITVVVVTRRKAGEEDRQSKEG
ncbi:MAG: hypothetical protein H5T72_07070 [Actinobacteria bacterium]|nr:hypothetical protein [Actinomycetota bacterium]